MAGGSAGQEAPGQHPLKLGGGVHQNNVPRWTISGGYYLAIIRPNVKRGQILFRSFPSGGSMEDNQYSLYYHILNITNILSGPF